MNHQTTITTSVQTLMEQIFRQSRLNASFELLWYCFSKLVCACLFDCFSFGWKCEYWNMGVIYLELVQLTISNRYTSRLYSKMSVLVQSCVLRKTRLNNTLTHFFFRTKNCQWTIICITHGHNTNTLMAEDHRKWKVLSTDVIMLKNCNKMVLRRPGEQRGWERRPVERVRVETRWKQRVGEDTMWGKGVRKETKQEETR